MRRVSRPPRRRTRVPGTAPATCAHDRTTVRMRSRGRGMRAPLPATAAATSVVVVGQGIAEVLTYAIGVAISPVPIIAVILMLFSRRARVNGPMFMFGWLLALSVVSGLAYVLADTGDAATTAPPPTRSRGARSCSASSSCCSPCGRGGKGPHREPSRRCRSGWRASTRSRPRRRSCSGRCSPASTRRTCSWPSRRAGLAQLGLSTTDSVVSLIVFVVVGSLTIAGPVVYYLVGGDRAKAELDSAEELARGAQRRRHDGAVPRLRGRPDSKGLPPLT